MGGYHAGAADHLYGGPRPMLQKGPSGGTWARTNSAKDMQDADKEDAIVLAVTRDGNIFLRTTQIKKEEITAQVKDRIASRLDKTVYVKSDAAPPSTVMSSRVVDEIRSAGVDQVGLFDRTGTREVHLRLLRRRPIKRLGG